MSSGVLAWLTHRLTGVVLFIGMAAHFYVMHLGGAPLTYESVALRLQSPFWKGFNILLLASVLYHGLYGLWGIAIEYVRPGRWLYACKAALLLSSAVLMAAGVRILF